MCTTGEKTQRPVENFVGGRLNPELLENRAHDTHNFHGCSSEFSGSYSTVIHIYTGVNTTTPISISLALPLTKLWTSSAEAAQRPYTDWSDLCHNKRPHDVEGYE